MSWFDLSTVMHRRGDAEATRIAVQRSDITIRFGRELIGQLGWSRGDKVTVIVGRDEHFGLVRLAKGQSGWTLQHPGGSSKHGNDALVKLGRMIHGQPALPELPERLPATPVETTVDAGMVEFRLPWLAVGEQQIPERAAVYDPEPKPPEAHGEAVDGAGSSSETNARQSGPADGRRSGARGEEDGQTRASAEDVGGSPATERAGPPTPRSIPGLPGRKREQVQSRSLAEVETATRDPSPRDNPNEKGAFGRMSATQTEEFVRAVAAGASRRDLKAIADKLPARYSPGTINYLKDKLAHRIEVARKTEPRPVQRQPLPAPVTPVTLAEPDAAEQPTGPPPIPETTLKFLREEIVPVMASLGHKVTLSDDKTQLYLQESGGPVKLPVTAAELVARVNALLELEAEEALALPSAA